MYDSQPVTITVAILCEIATRNAQETQDLLNAIRDEAAKWLSFAYSIFDLGESMLFVAVTGTAVIIEALAE